MSLYFIQLEWLPQLNKLSKHKKNGYNSINFTDIRVKFCMLVGESHPQQKLRTLTAHQKSAFKTLLLNSGDNCTCLVVKYTMNPWTDFNEILRKILNNWTPTTD